MPKAKAFDTPALANPAFAWSRSFLNNRFVYLVLSQRAKGLSIGINLNSDRRCNFDCVYCEVDRSVPALDTTVDVQVMETELEAMLLQVRENKIRDLVGFSHLPAELLGLKEVALSGDGEPTLSQQFSEIVAGVVGVRARSLLPFFKVVLITNTAGLPLPDVQAGLRLLTNRDEIWVKLEAGTQAYMDKINCPDLTLTEVMMNILSVARHRPVVIQSLFPLFHGEEPSEDEIDEYVQRLRELQKADAQIASVQIYSAHRPPHQPACSHLALATLSRIASKVRSGTGLRAEVF